jgi:DnaK suppressor protein
MDESRARTLVEAERNRVQMLLNDVTESGRDDRSAEGEPGDSSDRSEPLTAEAGDDAVAANLRDRLAALDRAEERINSGTFGKSIRSGAIIPDERLEADPAAELTVEETE